MGAQKPEDIAEVNAVIARTPVAGLHSG